VAKIQKRRAEKRRRKEVRRKEAEEKKKKPRNKRMIKEWEIWNKKEEAAESKEEVKKLVSQRFQK